MRNVNIYFRWKCLDAGRGREGVWQNTSPIPNILTWIPIRAEGGDDGQNDDLHEAFVNEWARDLKLVEDLGARNGTSVNGAFKVVTWRGWCQFGIHRKQWRRQKVARLVALFVFFVRRLCIDLAVAFNSASWQRRRRRSPWHTIESDADINRKWRWHQSLGNWSFTTKTKQKPGRNERKKEYQ